VDGILSSSRMMVRSISAVTLFTLIAAGPVFAQHDPDDTSRSPSSGARKKMVGQCDATCRWLSAALAAIGVAAIATLDAEDAASVGDVTRLIPAAAGLAMTLGARDSEGRKQWLLAGSTSLAATWGLKHIADKERPNAHNKRSFPSGHASAGFFGASFIYRRYGPRWGVPAWVVAAYTGASRVNAERHYVDDVLSSLSLGLMSNWLFTSPISDRLALNPMLAGDGFGLSVSIPTSSVIGGGDEATAWLRRPHFRYGWEFGPAWVSEDLVTTHGDPIDFRFEALNDPFYSARIALEWSPSNPRQELDFGFTPYEIRDFGSFTEDTDFGGVTFPGGEDLRIRHVAYDLTARYRYHLFQRGPLDIRVGAGAAFLYTVAGLAQTPRRESIGYLDFTEVRDLAVIPIVHLMLGLEFGNSERWLLYVEADGMDLSSYRYIDATAQLRYRVSPRWDVGLGYRRLERVVDQGSLSNTTDRTQYTAHIGYRF